MICFYVLMGENDIIALQLFCPACKLITFRFYETIKMRFVHKLHEKHFYTNLVLKTNKILFADFVGTATAELFKMCPCGLVISLFSHRSSVSFRKHQIKF